MVNNFNFRKESNGIVTRPIAAIKQELEPDIGYKDRKL